MRREAQKRSPLMALAATCLLALTACGPLTSDAIPPANSPVVAPAIPTEASAFPREARECVAPAEPSPAMTEGPYFKSGSPERTSLQEDGIPGERLRISGSVLTTECEPVAGAMLDFWQADGEGAYDNFGFRLRGHQFTDATGAYELATVLPARYGGRTAHIHVKVQAPGGEVITTQIFFPNEQRNQSDPIFDDRLVIELAQADGGLEGVFTFIIAEP